MELPEWLCHKKVRAAKIFAIHHTEEGAKLELELPASIGAGEPNPLIDVDAAWMARFTPVNGGYFVIYEDGYRSFSPAKAFEEGYSLIVPPAEG